MPASARTATSSVFPFCLSHHDANCATETTYHRGFALVHGPVRCTAMAVDPRLVFLMPIQRLVRLLIHHQVGPSPPWEGRGPELAWERLKGSSGPSLP